MTRLQLLCGLGICLTTSAQAWEQVLIDQDTPAQNWRVTSEELGIKAAPAFSVSLRTLHGGRQEGVSLIEIDNGTMKMTVIPTRGMNVLQAVAGDVRLGWDSPVEEVVNPAFIELSGRAANIPASRVVLQIDEEPPYAIRLRGDLQEKAFKKVDFSIVTELSTTPGRAGFSLHDTLTNNGDYPKEYQALYHTNFGTPLLEQGAKFVAPVKQISPFNEKAKVDLGDWQTYRGPTADYDETVYNVVPYADAKGETLAMLHNRAGELGIAVGFNTSELPVFSLWKNTDTEKQGYVTGLEPGTSFSYNRRYQRPLGLVPTVEPGQQRHFHVNYELLADRAAVDDARKRIEAIQAGRATEVREQPLVDLDKE